MAFLEDCPPADLRRFAICWLTSDRNCDWSLATSLYDSKVKPASFKTVTGRAVTRVVKGTELEGMGGGGGGGGKKRKVEEEGEGEQPKKKAKKAKKAKGEDEEKIKGEAEDDEGGEIF